MSGSPDWRPTASLDVLRLRARLMGVVRRFFDDRGYWEVDTPLVSHERVIDANIEPFVAVAESAAAVGTQPSAGPVLYLQTSPEFAMKRLLAAGTGSIYQLGHVFRHGERGRLHGPEFSMLEWYGVGDTHLAQMQVVEDLVIAVFQSVAAEGRRGTASTRPVSLPPTPFLRTTYRAAFVQHAGADLAVISASQLAQWCVDGGFIAPPGLAADDRDGWLNWLLAELVEPKLGIERPEFLMDYPASQASLARVRPEVPPVAERFELYFGGIELCNGYHELPDADELRRRIGVESKQRRREGLAPLPEPKHLLAATQAGLPDCSGVALGFDRLLMIAMGAGSIGEVTPFGFENY
ncbi:MAG: EF-P lysine aminoacylase GenX [Planctomycetaceae bacterium]|nr:EF-P lysine aminoacylase GenX [Planctomycetaceae bacterium]